MKKKLVMLAFAGIMAVTSLAGCSKLEDTEVVATVNKKDITAGVANFYARMTQAQYETYYAGYMGDDMWASEAAEGENYEDTVKEGILESLETMVLLEEHMGEYEVVLSDEEKTAITNAARDFDEANALEEKEKVSGGKKNVERVLTLMTIQNKMTAAIKAKADTEVSDEEAAQKKMQYVEFSFSATDEEGNSVNLTDEEKTELKKKADSFAEGAKTAPDFAAFAAAQGQEKKDAAFDAKSTSIPTELAKEADKLGENETTGVVETDSGYYVAKVVSLFDREATDANKKTVLSQRQQDLYDETTKKWMDNAEITVDKKVWKKVDFNRLSVTMRQDDTDPYADEVKTDDQAEEETEE